MLLGWDNPVVGHQLPVRDYVYPELNASPAVADLQDERLAAWYRVITAWGRGVFTASSSDPDCVHYDVSVLCAHRRSTAGRSVSRQAAVSTPLCYRDVLDPTQAFHLQDLSPRQGLDLSLDSGLSESRGDRKSLRETSWRSAAVRTSWQCHLIMWDLG